MEMAKPLIFHQFPTEVGNHFRPCRGLKLGFLLQLGGGFNYVLYSPLLGEMIQFDESFSKGLKSRAS